MQKQELIEVILTTHESLNLSMIDTIIHISEEYNIEVEQIAQQIKSNTKIKEALKKEGKELNLFK